MLAIMITTHIQSWNSSLITIKLNWSQQLCALHFCKLSSLKVIQATKTDFCYNNYTFISTWHYTCTHACTHKHYTYTKIMIIVNVSTSIYQWPYNICLQITFIPHTKVLREISYAVWKRLFAWKTFNKADLLHCSIGNSNFVVKNLRLKVFSSIRFTSDFDIQHS